MALYMQDPYRKPNYPVHVGKPAAQPAVSGEGYYESSYSAPSLDVDSSGIWERAEAAMVRFMCLTSGQWRQKTDGLRHGQK